MALTAIAAVTIAHERFLPIRPATPPHSPLPLLVGDILQHVSEVRLAWQAQGRDEWVDYRGRRVRVNRQGLPHADSTGIARCLPAQAHQNMYHGPLVIWLRADTDGGPWVEYRIDESDDAVPRLRVISSPST